MKVIIEGDVDGEATAGELNHRLIQQRARNLGSRMCRQEYIFHERLTCDTLQEQFQISDLP